MYWLCTSWSFTVSIVCILFLLEADDVTGRRVRCSTPTLNNGRVKVRNRGRTAKFICFRQYQLVGNRYATCLRGKWSMDPPMCIKSGCTRYDAPANGNVIESYRGAFLEFDCKPGYTLYGNSAIYCDGSFWNGTAPFCAVNAQPSAQSCDFESDDMCGWQQDPANDFDWRRNNHGTSSGHVGTGPSYDHTYGFGKGGYYLYIEASSPRKPNDSARLYSPVYSASLSQDACFIMWYHMFGATTGFLNVYMKKENVGSSSDIRLFSRNGDHGNHWWQGFMRIPPSTVKFQIIIEGIRGSSYVGDTAIDDVKLTNGTECLIMTTAAPTKATSISGSMIGSCRNRCGNIYIESEDCSCAPDCTREGICCSDYMQLCTGGGSNTPAVTSSLVMTSSLGLSTHSQESAGGTISMVTTTSSMYPFTSVQSSTPTSTAKASSPEMTSSSIMMSHPVTTATVMPSSKLYTNVTSPSGTTIHVSTIVPSTMLTAVSSIEVTPSTVRDLTITTSTTIPPATTNNISPETRNVQTSSFPLVTTDREITLYASVLPNTLTETTSAKTMPVTESFPASTTTTLPHLFTLSLTSPFVSSSQTPVELSTDIARIFPTEDRSGNNIPLFLPTENPSLTNDGNNVTVVTIKNAIDVFGPELQDEPDAARKTAVSKQSGLSWPVIAGISLTMGVVVLVVVAVSLTLYKRRKPNQSLLAEDSEIRYLHNGDLGIEIEPEVELDFTEAMPSKTTSSVL